MNKRYVSYIISLIIIILFSSGCAKWIVSQGINFAVPVMLETGLDSFLKENDPIIAETSIASNLKVLEIMLETSPNNKLLLNNTAFGYCAYAISFVEYEMEKAGFNENEELETFHRNRAKNLYLRSREYGFQSLQLTSAGKRLVELITSDTIEMDKIDAQLKRIQKDQNQALFWTTIAWGSYLQISRDNVTELALVPIFRAMNRRIQELDAEYFFGMPVMIDAMLLSMSPMFGGDETQSAEKFEKVMDMNNGMFLMSQVFKARFYCTQFDHSEEGIAILNEVIEKDTSKWPAKYNLMNIIAKRKARLYLKFADDIF